MPTIIFTLAPPLDSQIRDMITPSVAFVAGEVQNAPTFTLELDVSASADDVAQAIIGHRAFGWIGEVVP